MNFNKIKNTLILALVVAAVYQTGTLWLEGTTSHNVFYSFFTSFGKNSQSLATDAIAIEPEKVILGYGNKKYSLFYPRLDPNSMMNKINTSIEDIMKNGTFKESQPVDWDKMLNTKVVVLSFPFHVSVAEYKKSYHVKNSTFSTQIPDFDTVVLVPQRSLSETSLVYFINDQTKEAACFALDKSKAFIDLYSALENHQQQVQTDLNYISTKQNSFHLFPEDTFVPQWARTSFEYSALKKSNPFAVSGEVYAVNLESQIAGFFQNAVPHLSDKDTSGVYTFSDEETVVKYYPTGILEYYSYVTYDSNSEQTVSSAYSACVAFLKKDASLSTGIYLSDVQLTSEGLIFYYDYQVSNLPIVFSEEEKKNVSFSHAIEIVVKNNVVKKYRRYAFDFEEDPTQKLSMNIDFITALNSVMNQYTGEKVITQIENIELGYFVDGQDEVGRKWFLIMDQKLYICDSY